MIILIKNESEIRYKITPGKVWREKWTELGLERIVGKGFCGGNRQGNGKTGKKKFF